MSGARPQIIDGKALAREIRARVAIEASRLSAEGRAPCLAAVLVGDDPASTTYSQSQERLAREVGIDYRLVTLTPQTDQRAALAAIAALNEDPGVSGIMLYLPVSAPLDGFILQQAIRADKDVEGVGAMNLGLLAMGREALVPCTAAAALACLKSTGMVIAGRHAVVLGRSVIVGKPLAMLLLAEHATVTQCHSRTRDLASHTKRAEILIVAAGSPGLIGAEHVSPGAVVIDIGTNRVTDHDTGGSPRTRITGDVRYNEVAPLAGAITPVPGGVGPVTVAMLLSNVVDAASRSGARTHQR